MERKSAWTLPMGEQEIVTSYRTAATPQKQIRILADLNDCDKKTIANILTAAGCELPGNMKPKKKPEAAEPTETAAATEGKSEPEFILEPCKRPSSELLAAAVEAIREHFPDGAIVDETNAFRFVEYVRGVLTLLQKTTEERP